MKEYLHPEMELIALDTEDVMDALKDSKGNTSDSSEESTSANPATNIDQKRNDVWQWME